MVVIDLVLIVELDLGIGALALAVLELVALVCHRVVAEYLCHLAVCCVAFLAPLMVPHREIDEVCVAPAVGVSHLYIIHTWASLLRCVSCSAAVGLAVCAVRVHLAALGNDVVLVLSLAVHTHEVDIYLILLGHAPCETGTSEDVVGAMLACACLSLVAVAAEIAGIGVTLVVETHVAVVESAVCVELAAAEVYVGTCIVAAFAVGTRLCAAVVSGLAVTLEDDVDDAGSAFGRVLCRRVGDYLNLLDGAGWHLLKDVALIVGC